MKVSRCKRFLASSARVNTEFASGLTHGLPAGAAFTSLMPRETNDGGPGQVQRLGRRRFAETSSSPKQYRTRPRPAPTLTRPERHAPNRARE